MAAAVIVGLLPTAYAVTHPKVGLATTAYASAVLADNPTVFYRLDESAGTTATDSSGNGHDGSIASSGITYGVTGPTADSSDSGETGISDDGSVVGVTASDSPLPSGDQPRTMELWAKSTANQTGIDEMAYGTGSTYEGSFLDIYNTTSQFCLCIYGDRALFNTSVNLDDGNWHQLAITYDGDVTVSGYVDGTLVGTDQLSEAANTVTGGPGLGIAGSNVGTPTKFDGSVADAAIYPTALSPARICAHVTAAGLTCPNAPSATLSDYVTDLDYSQWATNGCDQAEATYSPTVLSAQVILDFGQPDDTGGEYGTLLIDSGDTFAQWDSGGDSGIRYLLANYLDGYWSCHSSSTPPLDVVVGVSNIYSDIDTSTNTNGYQMGEVVSALDSWLSGNGESSLMVVSAGSDTETGWADHSHTVNYLDQVAAAGGDYDGIWDFGDAGSCSYTGYTGSAECGVTGWTEAQVLDIAWGESWAAPVPEIYNTGGYQAEQWYWLSKGSVSTSGYPIGFRSELTQSAACTQHGGCTDTDNTPSTGWTQLYDQLTSDAATSAGAAYMNWSDDIKYLG